MQRNRGEKNRMGKTKRLKKKRSLLENWRYKGGVSCKNGHKKGQKWPAPNRKQKGLRTGARIHRRPIQKKIYTTQIITMV